MRENSKKWLAGLACALALTGCANTEPTETTIPPTTEPVVETTEPIDSVYIPESPVELATEGAVKLHEADGSVTGIGVLGERLLIALDGDRLQILSMDTMEVCKERPLDSLLSWADSSLTIQSGGMAYYDAAGGSYMLLDANLAATAMAAIQEPLSCHPVISPDFSTIYYATEGSIKAMDFNSGVSRTLREEYGKVTSMGRPLLDGSLLYYTRLLEDGTTQTCFVSTTDGSTRHTGPFRGQLMNWGSSISGVMKLEQPMGQSAWILTGGADGRAALLHAAEGWDSVLFPGENRAVTQRILEEAVELSCYDLTTGSLMARVIIPDTGTEFAYTCMNGDEIWLCDGVSGRFYCWDITMTPAEGESLTPVATLAQESADDLQIFHTRLEELAGQYGVKLSLVTRENRTDGVNYQVYPDYRTELYTAAMEELEQILTEIPGEFWERIAGHTKSGKLEIRLVDHFDPAQPLQEGTGSYDVRNGELVVEVSICRDMRAIFYHELCHAMEVRIASSSSRLNSWEKLNPSNFTYAGEATESEYLDFGSNYFADAYGLISAREDRAQIFLYAMLEGQADRFASEPMQAKLSRLCEIIRSIYKLDDSLILPWEQYLTTK